jgi:arginyl-tRNA synthetase
MIHQLIAPAFEKALQAIDCAGLVQLAFEQPRVAEHGDLSTNIAMMLARPLKKAPRQIAELIIAQLEFPQGFISKVEIAGAGFINLHFGPALYHSLLQQIQNLGVDHGRTDIGKGKTANIEYVSANPTGRLHLGHGRNAAIGDTVANLLDWAGFTVTKEYYFNNAGNQMNMLAKSIFARYMHLCGHADYPFPEDGYHGDYIHEIAAIAKLELGDGITLLDEENLIRFRKIGEKWCFASILATLQRMGIQQDTYFNEDSLYQDGTIEKLLIELESKQLSYQKDGATWMKFSAIDEKLTDRVIVKSTGEPTYRLPDIAYHRNKFERGYDLIIDIFGADHIATIPDVTAAVKALGYDTSKLKVLIYQFVTLWENGEQVKMSKRSGKSYTLDDLIEEVGADVVRFFFIMRGAQTQLEFDLSMAREQNEKNPVFYLQYVHARICSILANAEQKSIMLSGNHSVESLQHPAEFNLIQTIARFNDTAARAALALEPQIIAEYLREVSAAFHTFYHDCRIIGAEQELMYARLSLALAVKTVISNGLRMLGISAPEKM